jgi:ribose transport system ATP-binding protein
VSTSPLLEVQSLRKLFPGVIALDGVSLKLNSGEILAVIGENGAGKSTLMKCLAGIYTPDAGSILLSGQPAPLGNIRDALRHGISLIHQELNLAENLSVAANLYLGREPRFGGPLGILASRRMRSGAKELMARVGLECSPDAIVGQLAPGQRQLVEIARALSLQVRILIMDEPTSSLTPREATKLFAVMADLKRQGVAVVYISHRLVEVQATADRVIVLRDGKNAGELHRAAAAPRPQDEISHDTMVRLMVGRDLKQYFHKQHGPQRDKPPRLQVKQVRYLGGPAVPVSFDVLPGEILGVAGLMGAGRTELAEAIFGIRRLVAGEVRLDGESITIKRPGQAVDAGMVLVPEDRRQNGLIVEDTIEHNIGLPNLDRLSHLGLVSRGREHELAKKMAGRLQIRARNLRQLTAVLSGGNQQKVVVGKWLAREPRVLIFDEPTRGIDVGAKSEIYALMDGLAGVGVAILMISSDLEEILGMSDRVAVLHQGRLAGILSRQQLNEEAIMRLATGGDVRA